MIKKSAKFEDYIINIIEDSSVEVLKNGEKSSNTVSELRTISNKISFPYDEGWNTRQFGKKLVEFLSENNIHFRFVASELVNICKNYKADKAHFTEKQEVDKKINDIKKYPHLFVLACLMDRQIKAERAWEIPYRICKDLCNDNFSFKAHSKLLSNERIIIDYFNKNNLHRFNSKMAQIYIDAIYRIRDKYNGDASLIWNGNNSSAEVIYRFLCFNGCGVKIASMATNLLHRIYGIKYTDYSVLDISPDIHVRRVLYRLGLIENMVDVNLVIYRARSINPSYPGILDKCCWDIGRKYCYPTNPNCEKCDLNKICCKLINDLNDPNDHKK